MNLQKRTPYRNKAILKSAKGEDCTMESPWCSYHLETVRACHLNNELGADIGKGKGLKADDFAIFFGCQGCEDWYTKGYLDPSTLFSKESSEYNLSIPDLEAQRDWYAFRAVLRTWRRLLDKGVLR